MSTRKLKSRNKTNIEKGWVISWTMVTMLHKSERMIDSQAEYNKKK